VGWREVGRVVTSPKHGISQEKENKHLLQLQQVRCSKKLDSRRRWLKGISSALGGRRFPDCLTRGK
jgi:hypothetical protein